MVPPVWPGFSIIRVVWVLHRELIVNPGGRLVYFTKPRGAIITRVLNREAVVNPTGSLAKIRKQWHVDKNRGCQEMDLERPQRSEVHKPK